MTDASSNIRNWFNGLIALCKCDNTILLSSDIIPDVTFTIESFVYFNDLDNYSTIFASSEDSFTTGGFKLEIHGSKLRVQGNSFEHASGSTTLSTDRWHHFAFSRTSGGNAYSFVDGVLVNSVLPGLIHTAMWERAAGEIAESTGSSAEEVIKKNGFSVPIGRYGTSEEVAALVVFLCSNAASYINGSAIEVDGGQAGHI